MSAGNDRFESYTRSASFALSLSSNMIQLLLWLHTVSDLASRYPWFRPREANFGEPTQVAIDWSSSAVKALARRGLVDVNPQAPPCCFHEVIRLTEAGRLMALLLIEAGFLSSLLFTDQIPPHPDDRIKIRLDGGPTPPKPHDRRLDVMLERDRPFLMMLREPAVAS